MAERLVFIDCMAAGISGDMLLGALADLGVGQDTLASVASAVEEHLPGCKRLDVSVREVERQGLRAVRVEVLAEEERADRQGRELREALEACLEELGLPKEASELATTALNLILAAEARVHGAPPAEVHLHELGSADTLVDILGVAAGLQELGLLGQARFLCSPVAVGGGLVRFSHGSTSVPAPATLEILASRGLPIIGGPVEAELTTPTGAALLTALVGGSWTRFPPPMRPTRVGYGAGARDISGLPNVLRVVVGEALELPLAADRVCLVETNIDDATGEVLGHALERLMGQEGVRDVCFIPVFAKKGRPGYIVRVLTDAWAVGQVARLLMEETGTLGVRVQAVERLVLEREQVELQVLGRTVRLKVARDADGRVVRIKPEYEDLKALAHELGKPLREVAELVLESARRKGIC